MKRTFILSALLCIKSLAGYSQRGEMILISKLLNADTVLLVSHEDTYGVKVKDEDTGREIPLPKLIISGRPNNKIIKEHKIVRGRLLDTLIQILARPFSDSAVFSSECFMPHHAVFVIKNGKTSYLEICFHCREFLASKDLNKLYAFDDQKWSELERFFRKLGFKYELDTMNQ